MISIEPQRIIFFKLRKFLFLLEYFSINFKFFFTVQSNVYVGQQNTKCNELNYLYKTLTKHQQSWRKMLEKIER